MISDYSNNFCNKKAVSSNKADDCDKIKIIKNSQSMQWRELVTIAEFYCRMLRRPLFSCSCESNGVEKGGGMKLVCLCMQVHGIIRRASTFNTHRIEHLYENPMSHAEGGL